MDKDFEQSITDVLDALDIKEQRKALRSAMRREGNRLKKQAGQTLAANGLHHGVEVGKTLIVRVYPDRYGAGFMVTSKPRGKRGYYKNTRGKEKPVAMWATEGTTQRYKRGNKKPSTGAMKRYHYLEDTENSAKHVVERRLWTDFEKNLQKALRKKGL